MAADSMPSWSELPPRGLIGEAMRSVFLLCLGCAVALSQQKEDELDIPRSSVPLAPAALTWGQPFDPLTRGAKLRYQLYQTFGPTALGRTTIIAAIDQWTNTPEEWGQGWDAYGRRFGSHTAVTLARRAIQFGVGTMRREDPRFFRSGESTVGRRIRNQLIQTVWVRSDSGGTTLAAGRILGVIAGTQVSRIWIPQSEEGFSYNLGRAGLVLATDIGTRVLREFWPDIRQRLRRPKTNGGPGNSPNPP
jgi:hypothetical protein